jgi:cysteinyl-tRNA synthetase
MSQEYLGDTLDIHCGGEDNIFPHHEAEIAQSECATGKPFTRYWIHNRHLLVDGTKMSKSKGNFYKLEDVTGQGYSPMDLRMLFLSSHYRSQMNFTWDSLASARKNKETIFALAERLESADSGTEDVTSSFRNDFFEAIEDDLNTPLALSVLLAFANKANATLDAGTSIDTTKAKTFLAEAFTVFGFIRETVEIPAHIRTLADERETARLAKDFAASDLLRDRLLSAGWLVEDTPQGPKLKKR